MLASRTVAGLLLACALAGPACAPTTPARDPSANSTVIPQEVPDAEFARSLVGVLRDGSRTEARQKVLLGVVKRQLVHAGQRFDRGASERGTQSVLGALYLMRAGEQSPAVIDRETARAIDGAISKLSARGDIGRSRVLLALRSATGSQVERKDLDAHIEALERFQRETLTGKALEKAGDVERTAVGKAMLSPEHIDQAIAAISAWIDLGIAGKVAFDETNKRPPPEEAIEIARSLSSGAATVLALMLRYGDVPGAIERITSSSARRVMDPKFFSQLKSVEKRDDASSYRDLFDALAEDTGGRVGGEIGIDPDLYAAARMTILVEAYRREPSHMRTALELSRALTGFGMGEAVPLLMTTAMRDGTSPGDVIQAMRAVANAIMADANVNDVAGASRTIAECKPLLERAKSLLSSRGGIAAVAELRYSMASILLRGGYLQDARAILGEALSEAPRPGGYLLRARVHRQTNDLALALEDVRRAISAQGSDPLDIAEARLLEFEIQRDLGSAAESKEALSAALKNATLTVDKRQSGAQRVRALATLGRVLQAYGDRDGARRAFERAMEAVSGDRDLVGSTMLQAASAGLVLGDRDGVRTALRRGVDAGAPQDDLVYGALWLMLADRQAGAKPDESVIGILDGAATQPTWIGRLAGWARGKIPDEALARGAASEASRVEAAFYVAMARRAGGGSADAALRLVATSPVLQLNEVRIARDLLAPPPAFGVPKDVKIP